MKDFSDTSGVTSADAVGDAGDVAGGGTWGGSETAGDIGNVAGLGVVSGAWDTGWSGSETTGDAAGPVADAETGEEPTSAEGTGEEVTGGAEVGVSRQELGQRSEDLAACLVRDVEGHELLTIHTEGSRPQGLDLETLGPDGRIHVIEVKGTAARDYRPPRMTRNVGEMQMSREWVAATLNRDGQTSVEGVEAIGEGPDQVGRSVIQVDERGETVSVWEQVADDGRLDTSGGPDRVYGLADLRDVEKDDLRDAGRVGL